MTSLIEDKDFVSYIETIYKICISLEKKMILLHHKDYPIQDWLKLAKEENVLAVCEHDGQNIEKNFSNSVQTFFKNNQNLNPIIILDDTNYMEIESLLRPHLIMEMGCYIHVHFKESTITIDYQGYNAGTQYQITIDITNVSNKWYVEKIIREGFSEFYNVFYHDEKPEVSIETIEVGTQKAKK